MMHFGKYREFEFKLFVLCVMNETDVNCYIYALVEDAETCDIATWWRMFVLVGIPSRQLHALGLPASG